MIATFSGIRDLAPESYANVELAVLDTAIKFDELRFGGAIGSDTIALSVACDADVRSVLHVFVPWTVKDQPKRAQETIKCADLVTELKLIRDNRAYLIRNDTMLMGTDQLIAFIDDREEGGTAYTIKRALSKSIPTRIVQVKKIEKKKENPALYVPLELSPRTLHGIFPYESERKKHTTVTDALRASRIIRHLKVGIIVNDELNWLARHVSNYLYENGLIRPNIVPMPRRIPNVESDLLPLAYKVSEITGQTVLNNWLVRTSEPKGGKVVALRVRHPSEEHSLTMKVMGEPSDVVILDNVITSGGTAIGAQQAVLRDTNLIVPVLSILWSNDLGIGDIKNGS